MYVLYKALVSFDHLESYIEQNSLDVIYSNVAISWAIHDQNLDESIDISNKTTTNIKSEDFCASVDLGGFFMYNHKTFHQKQVIDCLKTHFPSFRKAYEILSDELSKKRYFAFLMFCLCPYTNRFFSELFEMNPPVLPFEGDEIERIITNQVEIGDKKPSFTLSLVYGFPQVKDLPLLLHTINPNQQFTVGLYENQRKYQLVFSAKPEGHEDATQWGGFTTERGAVEMLSPVSEEIPATEQAPIQEELPEQPSESEEIPTLEETFSDRTEGKISSGFDVLEAEIDQLGAKIDELEAEWDDFEREQEDEEEDDFDEDEYGMDELEPIFEPVPEPIPEPVPEPLPEPIPEPLPEPIPEPVPEPKEKPKFQISPEEAQAIEQLVSGIHLIPPEEESTEQQEEVFHILENMAPKLPPMESVTISRDALIRSLELLETMDEMVRYLRMKYLSEDVVYQNLLESMVLGIKSLKATLELNPDE